MAETTRAPLITDEDLAVYLDALKDWHVRNPRNITGDADRYALGKLRARLVAAALEAAADACPYRLWDEKTKTGVPAIRADDLRELAAEYRAGNR